MTSYIAMSFSFFSDIHLNIYAGMNLGIFLMMFWARRVRYHPSFLHSCPLAIFMFYENRFAFFLLNVRVHFRFFFPRDSTYNSQCIAVHTPRIKGDGEQGEVVRSKRKKKHNTEKPQREVRYHWPSNMIALLLFLLFLTLLVNAFQDAERLLVKFTFYSIKRKTIYVVFRERRMIR